MPSVLKAPFPYFGGKGSIAHEVWARFGPVRHLVDPFCGTLALLLERPGWKPEVLWTETVNDADGLLCNFWRALSADAEAVAAAADWPAVELDLYARNKALIGARKGLTEKLRADPRWYDAELAGWWVWGMGATIGDGWGAKLYKQLPKLSGHGSGIHRISGGGGLEARREVLRAIAPRLARLRVTCGDWRRVCSPTLVAKWKPGPVGVFLDPPYGEGNMDYAAGGNASKDVAAEVWAWACEVGELPNVRVCVAGYDDGRRPPKGWTTMPWKARGGYARAGTPGATNAARERLWFSRACEVP